MNRNYLWRFYKYKNNHKLVRSKKAHLFPLYDFSGSWGFQSALCGYGQYHRGTDEEPEAEDWCKTCFEKAEAKLRGLENALYGKA